MSVLSFFLTSLHLSAVGVVDALLTVCLRSSAAEPRSSAFAMHKSLADYAKTAAADTAVVHKG